MGSLRLERIPQSSKANGSVLSRGRFHGATSRSMRNHENGRDLGYLNDKGALVEVLSYKMELEEETACTGEPTDEDQPMPDEDQPMQRTMPDEDQTRTQTRAEPCVTSDESPPEHRPAADVGTQTVSSCFQIDVATQTRASDDLPAENLGTQDMQRQDPPPKARQPFWVPTDFNQHRISQQKPETYYIGN